MQQQYAVTLTLPLSLLASDLTDAQTQADALMTGSNATGALATALSAGLTAGESAFHFLPVSVPRFAVSDCKCWVSGRSKLLQLHVHLALCWWTKCLEDKTVQRPFENV